MNVTWRQFFPVLNERYSDLITHFNQFENCFNATASADQAVYITLEQVNNPDLFQKYQTMLNELQVFSEVLKRQVDCLVEFKTNELYKHQRKAHYGGEEHKETDLFIDIYTSTSEKCFKILQNISSIKWRIIPEDQRFQQLHLDIGKSFEKLTKHSLFVRVHPNLIVKQQVWLTVSICLMLSKSCLKFVETCKTLTCKIIRKDSHKEAEIDVVAGTLSGEDIVQIDLYKEHDKDFFSGEYKTKIKVVENVINPETNDYKYSYQLIFSPLFDVFEFCIDPVLSWPFMVHTGKVQDEKLTFYQFWTMAFGSKKATPSWSEFAQELQLIFSWITESTRVLSEDQLKHLEERFFSERPNRSVTWEEIFIKPLGDGISCSLWAYLYAAWDFMSEKTRNNKKVKECYEEGVLYGFVSHRRMKQLLRSKKEKPILGLRFSNSVPGAICAIVCDEDDNIEKYEPFLHRSEINEYRSLADSILECDKLSPVKYLYKRIDEGSQRSSKVIGKLKFFRQYSNAGPSRVTDGYKPRILPQPIIDDPTSETDDESSQHQQNNQPQRSTAPKDQCNRNQSNQTVNQTNNTLTPGASMMQNGLVNRRLQVSKNVEASQNVLVCDCNRSESKRKKHSNDQPLVNPVGTYSQNWEGNPQPRSLQYPVAANATSHYGQSNNNMEISGVMNRIGCMDFASDAYEPPNSYNKSSCRYSNCPPAFSSTFMQNSNMDRGAYQQHPLTCQTSQSSGMNIVPYQQQLAHPAQQHSDVRIRTPQQVLTHKLSLIPASDVEMYQ